MPDTTTQTPDVTRHDEPKSRGAGVGPGRILKRSWSRQMKILAAVVGLAIIVGGILLYRYFASYESTDDAQIDGYIYPSAPALRATSRA